MFSLATMLCRRALLQPTVVHTGLSHEAQYEQTLPLEGSFATTWMELVPFESHCLDKVAGGSTEVVSFEFHPELPCKIFSLFITSLSCVFLGLFPWGLPFIGAAVSLPL